MLIEIIPLRIELFNEPQLPFPLLFFDLFFPNDSRMHVLMKFIIHKNMDMIFFSKSSYNIIFVFPYPLGQIACYACVKGSIFLTGQYIHSWIFHASHI